jgi:glucokinase-like ROK family protein
VRTIPVLAHGIRTGDLALLRELNLSAILNALRGCAPVTRAALAAATGLNKTTVSSLVQQLIDVGFVVEVGIGRSEDMGRPGILLKLNPDAGRIIGVEIGADYTYVVVANFAATVIWRHHEHTDPSFDHQVRLARVEALVTHAIEQTAGGHGEVFGLGVGLPGLVDISSGVLRFAPNLHWLDIPVRSVLESHLRIPVYVDNEAHMAALGESYFGASRDAKSILCIYAGVGLGGGIVLDGRLQFSARGFAGEMGHMSMILGGLPCNCGSSGCWETVAGQGALFRRIEEAQAAGRHTSLERYTGKGGSALSVPRVMHAARSGDEVAIKALRETAYYLGVGIANLVNVLNPEIVVLGGVLSLASKHLMPTIVETVNQRALKWATESLRLEVATFGLEASAIGCVACVYQEVLTHPLLDRRQVAQA